MGYSTILDSVSTSIRALLVDAPLSWALLLVMLTCDVHALTVLSWRDVQVVEISSAVAF
jgi:hypothetical protein